MTYDYLPLARALLPETALVVGAVLVLGYDLTLGRREPVAIRRRNAAIAGLAACVAAVYLTFASEDAGAVYGGVLMYDAFASGARLAILALTAFTLAILPGTGRQENPAEYVAILLFAATGFTVMAAAQQLLVAFLALELASLSLYVLAGLDKRRPESSEAALKYFLFGGVSAAFLLFGFSLIYGLTGTIELPEISRRLAMLAPSPLLVVALVMILVGFGYKAAAAPFHLWAPDVYQGAPTPSAALIASASKLAGFALFWRLLWPGMSAAAGSLLPGSSSVGWLPVVAIVAAASLLLGNLGALAQSNVRRLLAYSAIAHAGALLLGLIAAGLVGPGPLFYYLATYGLATVAAFGVIGAVDPSGGCQQIGDLAGLRSRSPVLAGVLLVALLSLAGVPPLAGFFGKFAVFSSALKLGGLAGPAGWLTVLAILLSAVGLYYYLIVLKQAFVVAAPANPKPIVVPVATRFTLVVIASLLLVLGLWPRFLLELVS